MDHHYVLVDFENVPVKSLGLLQGEQFRICVFLGKNNTKIDVELAMAMQKFGDRAQYVKLTATGPNALDFHIAFHLGELVTKDASGVFHVISKDKGFDALIARLQGQKIKASRFDSIAGMPCFEQRAAPPIASPGVAKIESVAKAAAKPEPAPKKVDTSELDARVQIALADLKGRKTGHPAKLKTLINTIHAKIGKKLPVAAAEAVCQALVARKYVLVNGLKVTYKLPKAA